MVPERSKWLVEFPSAQVVPEVVVVSDCHSTFLVQKFLVQQTWLPNLQPLHLAVVIWGLVPVHCFLLHQMPKVRTLVHRYRQPWFELPGTNLPPSSPDA